MIEPLLSYDQIRLYPNKFDEGSRSVCNTKVALGKYYFNLPVIPANMVCCIDTNLARQLSENYYFYVMHRFGDTLNFVKIANSENWRVISISVGVKSCDKNLLQIILDNRLRIDYITIDIAHGHSEAMRDMISFIRNQFPSVYIIAGNVCTHDGAVQLEQWGANAIKVGIAQGGACTTYGKTGFGIPMFSCVREIARTRPYSNHVPDITIPIIADGGIKTNGDIAKAFVAGAYMVMAGSMFAALQDSPAETIGYEDAIYSKPNDTTPTKTVKYPIHKIYFGSASEANGNKKNIEGTTVYLPIDKRTYLEKLTEIKQDLQSAISYAGGISLDAFKNVNYGHTY